MKHTQGEWKVIGNNIASGDRHIADVSIGVANTPYIQVIEEERANAKLIAAAPELLENLVRIIDRIEEGGFQINFPSAYDRAKAIIKKATE